LIFGAFLYSTVFYPYTLKKGFFMREGKKS